MPIGRKRKTLPKDFGTLLTTAPLDELIAVFDRCALDARGGYHKGTALSFGEAPDDLIVWLVHQGLDPDTRDGSGETPLASRAIVWRARAAQIPLFLTLGADIEAPHRGGWTPLRLAVSRRADVAARLLIEHGAATSGDDWNPTTMLEGALRGVENASIVQAAAITDLMLEQGAEITETMRERIPRIGEMFERYRSVFNPDSVATTEAALQRLYTIFGIEPAAQRVLHDGTTPIDVPDGPWTDQHTALWELLVPGSGRAPTEQGEVIRITAKVSDEMARNGGANWGAPFRELVDTAASLMRTGTPLPDDALAELDTAVRDLRGGRGAEASLRTFSRLAVEWVAANPVPVPFQGGSDRR